MAFTVPFAELEGSPQEAWTAGGFKATVRVVCDWNSRNSLAWEFIRGGYYPRIPLTLALPRSVTIQPHPGMQLELSPGMAVYERAILTVEYDNARGDQQDETDPEGEILISEALEPNVEFMTLDPDDFQWEGAVGAYELTDSEAPGMLIRGLDYKVTLYGIRIIPSAVLTLVGCVNEDTITSKRLGLTFPPETLLYQPPTTSRQITTTGAEAWTLNYRFSYRKSGWNNFWNKRSQTWARIMVKDDTDTWVAYNSYPLANLRQLLRW